MQLNILLVQPPEYPVSCLSLTLVLIVLMLRRYVRVSGEEYKFKNYLFNSSHVFNKFLSVIFKFSARKFFAKPPPSLSIALGGRPCFMPIGTMSTSLVYISDRRIEVREFLTDL
jgi:hypothetical protein